MKNIRYFLLSSLMIFVFAASINAQNPNLPKRFVTVELFTNTPCPSCVAQNPGFFNLLTNYPDDVHLISFYPGQPYSSCPLFQANISENQFRTASRGIGSTPRVWLNGEVSKRSGQINASDIENFADDNSFISLTVEESGTPIVAATVRVQVYDTPPATIGRLFVAIIEKEVTLTGIPSSWEEHHFGVFRKFVTAQEGMDVDLTNNDFTLSFDYTIDAAWDPEQVHLLAWIEDATSKEIWNSGTRFDPFSGSINVSRHLSMDISPNPVTNQLNIELPDNFKFNKIEIMDITGKSMLVSNSINNIDVTNLTAGNYMIIAWSQESEHIVSQFTKQ